tara:strand:- start:839 stop:2038 length:1200 start_codon:yes stop_codon:yes gene_type:complete
MITKQKKGLDPDYPAVCPDHIIEQAAAFTAPRGRLEMGGVLIGHVDENGANVAVTGFFPEQIEETPGYCMFDGKWMAIAAAACDHANSTIDSEGPQIRVIGWIHTHPDIGIFLSGIDIKTFRQLRNQCPERRFVAVVVDPLRNEHGVFNTEKQANRPGHSAPSIEMSEELAQRYDVFLNRMRTIQNMHGTNALPCILPGVFRYKRLIAGDRDDVGIAEKQGLFSIKKAQFDSTEGMQKVQSRLVEMSGANRALTGSQRVLENSLKEIRIEVQKESKVRKKLELQIDTQAKQIMDLEASIKRVNAENTNLTSMLDNLNDKIAQMSPLLEDYELRNEKRFEMIMEENARLAQNLEDYKLKETQFVAVKEHGENILPNRKTLIRRPVYVVRHGPRMRYRRRR